LISVALALVLPEKLDDKVFSAGGWIGDSLKVAAPIILITGAGGIFGKMLQNSGIGDVVTSGLSGFQIGLFLPFLLAVCLKTTQGSSTATASIIAPLMPVLGLVSPGLVTLRVLTIGTGSAVASHVNNSGFWVVTQLTGMNVKQGYQTQTIGTILFGTSAMLIIYLISQFVS